MLYRRTRIISRGSMIPAIQDFAFNYKEKYNAFKNAITNMESGKFSKQDLYTVAHTTQELAGLVVAGKGIRNSVKLNKAIRNGAITHEKIFTFDYSFTFITYFFFKRNIKL